MNLMEKINNWTQNGYAGNHLQSNAKWAPHHGSYGFLGGLDSGAKLTTIRKVGEAANFQGSKEMWEREGTDAKRKKGKDFEGLKEWERDWRNPYIEGKEQDVEDKAWNIGTAGEGEGVGGSGYTFMGEEYDVGLIESAYEQAEKDIEIAEDVKAQAEIDYEQGLEDTEAQYRRDLTSMLRDKSGVTASGMTSMLESAGAEAQAGYAYSGPVEQRKAVEAADTRADMSDLMTAKYDLTEKKRQDIVDIEEAWSGPEGAQQAYEQSLTAAEDAKLQAASDMDALVTDTMETLDKLDIKVENIGMEDEALETLYTKSSGGGATDLWKNIVERSTYSNTLNKIRGLREGYENVRSDVLAGDYFSKKGE